VNVLSRSRIISGTAPSKREAKLVETKWQAARFSILVFGRNESPTFPRNHTSLTKPVIIAAREQRETFGCTKVSPTSNFLMLMLAPVSWSILLGTCFVDICCYNSGSLAHYKAIAPLCDFFPQLCLDNDKTLMHLWKPVAFADRMLSDRKLCRFVTKLFSNGKRMRMR